MHGRDILPQKHAQFGSVCTVPYLNLGLHSLLAVFVGGQFGLEPLHEDGDGGHVAVGEDNVGWVVHEHVSLHLQLWLLLQCFAQVVQLDLHLAWLVGNQNTSIIF